MGNEVSDKNRILALEQEVSSLRTQVDELLRSNYKVAYKLKMDNVPNTPDVHNPNARPGSAYDLTRQKVAYPILPGQRGYLGKRRGYNLGK